MEEMRSVSRSSQRLRYMAEVEVLKRDLGSLEQVRGAMNLSRRKMCQLLLVDPSAWTRWSKDESKVPPHIWKMLSLIKGRGAETAALNEVLLDPLYRELKRFKKRVFFTTLFAALSVFFSLIIVLYMTWGIY